MNRKILTVGLTGIVIGAFVAGAFTLAYTDARVQSIMSPQIDNIDRSITTLKSESDQHREALKLKADLAIITKYDSYFKEILQEQKATGERIARIEGSLELKPKQK